MSPQNPKIRPHDTSLRLAAKLCDMAAIGWSLFLVSTWGWIAMAHQRLLLALGAVLLFVVISELVGLYRSWRGASLEREFACVTFALFATLATVGIIGAVWPLAYLGSTLALASWFATALTFSLACRVLLRAISVWQVERGIGVRRYAIAGTNLLGVNLAENILQSPELGLRFSGFYDDRPDHRTAELPGALDRRCGNLDDLVDAGRRHEVDVVFITLPMRAERRIREVIRKLSDTTASVYLVPDLFVFQLLHSRWTDIQGLPVVSVHENPFYGVDGMLKRAVDVVLASLALLVLSLPMALVALTIKLTSPGPVFFRQRRYGLDGREIWVWKFRTMTVCEDGNQIKQAQQNDQRLTPIGGILRRTSIDELPQLFNVIGGSMSLVGPRPHASAHNEFYRRQIEGYMLRHKVKPGITGLAQVNGLRGETETVEKMAQRVVYDHRYIREWSIWLDLKIMWRTLGVVFSRENAY